MAKQFNTSSVESHEFSKNLNKDLGNIFVPPAVWGHARNAINNSKTGDLGKLGNEPANDLCTEMPYQVIGAIHQVADTWVIMSTNGTQSEIGIFYADTCKYFTAVNDPCLGFSAYNLIKGTSRATGDCVFESYWDDGNNNSRYISLNIEDPTINPFTNPESPIPWVQTCVTVAGCITCTNTSVLDCDKIRVAKLIDTPCIEVTKGTGGGTLLNGSYMVFIAYAISGQKISDWYMSNVQPLFEHENSACSLNVDILSMDTRYNEIIVAVGSVINQQTVVRQAGIYSTHQTRLSFDVIMDTWPAIPIEQLPIMTPIPDKSDQMYNVGPYLIRVGPTSKLDFNYQPIANQIVTKWVAVEYPADYYRKGGNHTNYLRDEVYPFFLRWVYDTGDKSNDYHIPGRPASPAIGDLNLPGADGIPGYDTFFFQATNTAVQTGGAAPALPDGGVPIAEGLMGYWQSTENYPDDKPEIWDTNTTVFPVSPYNNLGTMGPIPGTAQNLCGQKIRHHKFPEERIGAGTGTFNSGTGDRIRIMAVKFENILPPVENPQDPQSQWRYIPGIVGYEILRGSRNGNKTIIAKGMLNNMGQYTITGGSTNKQGLYPNYPYNDLSDDPFLSTSQTSRGFSFLGGLNSEQGYVPQSSFSDTNFTFHSPDTNFSNPFLSTKELKIYGNISGNVDGKFEFSEKHPKEKILTNLAFLLSAIAGLGAAGLAMGGKRTTRYIPPHTPGYSDTDWVPTTDIYTLVQAETGGPLPTPVAGATTGVVTKASLPVTTSPAVLHTAQVIAAEAALSGTNATYDAAKSVGANILTYLGGLPTNSNPLYTTYTTSNSALYTAGLGSLASGGNQIDQEDGQLERIPSPIRIAYGLPAFFNYWTEGSDSFMRLLRAIIKFTDFGLRYHSHGFYNTYSPSQQGNRRKAISNVNYIGPQLTDFGANSRVNNLYRSRTVAIESTSVSPPVTDDKTRYKVTDIAIPGFVSKPTETTIGSGTPYFIPSGNSGHQKCSSHYVALKQRLDNQYGQLTNIVQIPVSNCTISIIDPLTSLPKKTATSTGVLFGGDTYIGRYTEKNTFFYFYEWLFNQPDGAQLNYDAHKMFSGLYPRFWANFNEFETSDFTSSLMSNIVTPANWVTPNDFYNLDNLTPFNAFVAPKLSVKEAWFYLFNSGVRDFFVESEINIDLRDYGNNDTEIHYDPYRYTDTKSLFDTAIIKAGNYYKYDSSLSFARLFINYTSWGNMQSRDYDPFLAETCYQYRPRRAIYSLPAQFEGRRDNWLIFLANNYYDFLNRVTCIKPVNKNGAMIFFDAASPVQFQGTDQLQTGLGTKLTIGDGGLFSQPLQALTNADQPYEYASCQDRLSVINTPVGIFWMSQNQGKVFHLGQGVDPISDKDLKWWFNQYLPYKLTQLFSNFSLIDNPVVGIGCQAVYDNENGLAYFCKKDYVLAQGQSPSLIPGDGGTIRYDGDDNFTYIPTGLKIKLGDPLYFEDASWTVSYDPKTGGWLGWHDWHPELLLPGKNTFISIVTNAVSKKGGMWVHNERCDLYCNYYGKDYPFEIEYMVNTPAQITTLRSIEYFMEVYKYDPNCYDRFHVLDYNFDEAVIYNTEQCSGLLRMTPNPRPDPRLMITYPIINPTFIEILFSKVENKYRFNQFWDITDDRGEYPLYPLPPVAQRMIWNTGANGYVKALNPANLNYNKTEFQRKKFRHYTNSVFLRKRVIVGQQMTYKMLIMITENKQLNSPR